MKKLSYIFSLGIVCLSVSLNAQNLDDALRFNTRELTGTARSLGMANAFGALGGDLSAISINPAGIAVYRSSEFAFTPSFSFNKTNSGYSNFSSADDAFSFPFNQIGGVSTFQTLREKNEGIISTHFGVTYNRTADFNNSMYTQIGRNVSDYSGGNFSPNTLLANIILDADGYYENQLRGRASYAYNAYLIDPVTNSTYMTHYEMYDADNELIYDRNLNGINQNFEREQSGYSGEYGITLGANISNIVLLGGSVNFQSFKYEETAIFREINFNGFDPAFFDDLNYYEAYSKFSQNGFGINAKIGAIFNLHPIRLGASFHLPTFYAIDEDYLNGINAYFLNDDHLDEGMDGYFSYNYRTPYRAQGSFAYIIGTKAIISFDYELTDHTASKISAKDEYVPDFEDLNQDIKDYFKISHDLKAGIEIKPLPYLALRAGAAYFDSPFKDGMTDVKLDKWMYTGGFGIRNKSFFFDAAYSLTMYDDALSLNSYDMFYGVTDTPIEISNKRHQASFTFGWKF
ncbi:OmpP1/FadL family transporter [Carboxylicivirga caseinilyticus]|uniref:OmpP1/FadL family transporter n=1 Tax=Carboxylicivirga caseinilyticus TaxID=3417572 RepID=UPI003D334FFA|nr:hypothetical protein [Marinilabiliaceae bacterium A049]